MDIPLNLTIAVDVLSLHYDPELWGPTDPNKFYPLRLILIYITRRTYLITLSIKSFYFKDFRLKSNEILWLIWRLAWDHATALVNNKAPSFVYFMRSHFSLLS